MKKKIGNSGKFNEIFSTYMRRTKSEICGKNVFFCRLSRLNHIENYHLTPHPTPFVSCKLYLDNWSSDCYDRAIMFTVSAEFTCYWVSPKREYISVLVVNWWYCLLNLVSTIDQWMSRNYFCILQVTILAHSMTRTNCNQTNRKWNTKTYIFFFLNVPRALHPNAIIV